MIRGEGGEREGETEKGARKSTTTTMEHGEKAESFAA